jgi:hypothetical protein
MKIFKALGTGLERSAKAWKGVLITWFIFLVLTAFIALPAKSILRAGLGQSTITERLSKGFDIEALTDYGATWSAIAHSFTRGMFLLLLAGIIVNAFITGGLFNSLKSDSKFSSYEFFGSSARNFFPFLVITLLVSFIIIFTGGLMIGIPLQGVFSPGSGNEKTHFLLLKIFIALFVLLRIFFLLVVDYARAWQVKQEQIACFRALGFGFSRSFGKCLSSWPMMFLIWIIQVAFVFLVFKIIGSLKPATSIGVFGFFLLSQILFIIRIFLKTWRYGSVTALMELNEQPASLHLDLPASEVQV